MPDIQHITDIPDLKGKRVVCRLDLNTPLKNGKVNGEFRIHKALPTIKYLVNAGARVVIISHLGRDTSQTLQPVVDVLCKVAPVKFIPLLDDPKTIDEVAQLQEGEVLMLENLRSHKGETTNDPEFAQFLASLGDVYVNDAFSVSHREHASIVGIPKFIPGYIGLQFMEEIEHLSLAENPPHPFLFILGGAKCATKVPLIKQFLKKADTIFVGGVPANNFWAESGLSLGQSVVEEGDFGIAQLLGNEKIVLPADVTVRSKKGKAERELGAIEQDDIIVDIGPKARTQLAELVSKSAFVLWNGPLGNYEQGFEWGTAELLKIIADSSAQSVIGGGDTLTIALKLNMEDKFTFMSTGGGAMLDFLAHGTLPGLEALKK